MTLGHVLPSQPPGLSYWASREGSICYGMALFLVPVFLALALRIILARSRSLFPVSRVLASRFMSHVSRLTSVFVLWQFLFRLPIF